MINRISWSVIIFALGFYFALYHMREKPVRSVIPVCSEAQFQRTDFAWDPKLYRCHHV